ncbi:MAG: 3-hydroxy-3-methylglutaryl-coenzyme A reductase [Promethearchaeota archaeon]|nr:MAG: 3-hydroxy-3-methylglutaryl-coenzyme A reductase [Candidatus Lokiarchaeota archaeon]
MNDRNLNSNLSGFYKLSIEERQDILAEQLNLSDKEVQLLKTYGYFSSTQLSAMIENVVGSFQLPLGIACNFLINGKDTLIPMVIEEPSVVAAASNAAKIARTYGGFQCEDVKPIMIGQIQIIDLEDINTAEQLLFKRKVEILDLANKQDPLLVNLGGGAMDLKTRKLKTKRGEMLIVHLLVNVADAMGANVVNTMVEALAPFIENLTNGRVLLRIVSNLAIYRIAKAKAIFDKQLIGNEEVIDRILDADEFAQMDPYRAATHNKGIMNGISALTLATGNDTRAVEAGAHAYAALNDYYKPLTTYYKDKAGNLVGEIEIPLALGIIGGMTKLHPLANLNLKILKIKSANELCQIAAALGLAQNFGALRALTSEGIQKGHMKLHSRNIAKLAGVKDHLIDEVAQKLIATGIIRVDYAQKIVEELENKNKMKNNIKK